MDRGARIASRSDLPAVWSSGDAATDPLQCGGTPDLVLECASQQRSRNTREAVLARGWHLAVIRPERWRTANWNSVYVRRAAS